VQNPKQELLQAAWRETFVEEGNLTQYISHLRKALGDNSEDTRLIVPIARKGYQFTTDVTVAEAANIAKHGTLQAAATETSKSDARSVKFPTKEKATKSPALGPRLRKWFAGAALLAVVAAAVCLYSSYRHRVTLSATDTMVLADVKNERSDPVFDDALNTVLRYGIHPRPGLPAAWRTTFGSSGVSEIVGSQGFGGNRRDWSASTFADGLGAENDGRRSLRPQAV
jgi:Transcriptional regulatory protein, C terminal